MLLYIILLFDSRSKQYYLKWLFTSWSIFTLIRKNLIAKSLKHIYELRYDYKSQIKNKIMKTTFQTMNSVTKSHRGLISVIAISAVMVSALSYALTEKANAATFAPINGQMDLGDRGSNVTNLQTFMAANPTIYPEGLVTGYYGQLSAKSVRNFQTAYGIVSQGTPSTTGFGRVGPSTIVKLNNLIASGGWSPSSNDMSGPAFYNVGHSIGTNSISFTLSTNEVTNVYVAYATTPLMFNEGDINSVGFGPIGGMAVSSISGMSGSHSVTLSNLNSNTVYYYTIIATDAAGNKSAVGPNNVLRTN